ncbi:IS21-like element helper ATPase IstB [Pseudoalteromonas sp. T1lg88]|uniref:IS21-like element helper ATPase IstB n=1 Tax=Pseudoalteromonas sp. T1lg88 TaxID=2077104 RepID=UPI001319F050|nr:IS21-like element helper ATPase IstB [Pseudoalteromonas sp. T1lg88]
MNNELLFKRCKEIRLDAFPEAIAFQQAHSEYDEYPFESRLLELLESQAARNKAKKVVRLQKQAKLRFPDVYLEDIEYEFYPSLKVNQLKQLASGDWIRERRHLLIIGATGLGKTNIACVLAQAAMAQELSVIFYRLAYLLLELVAAQNEGKLANLMKKLNKMDLLIIDDWGNALMDKDERHLLFELIESRDKKGSLLITSQYPVEVWHDTFQDATLADSVLDRIVHNSHKIELKGKSIRELLSLRGERHD